MLFDEQHTVYHLLSLSQRIIVVLVLVLERPQRHCKLLISLLLYPFQSNTMSLPLKNLKRKDPSSLDDGAPINSSTSVATTITKRVTPPKEKGSSPYFTRLESMKEYQASANGDYILWKQWDVLETIPNKMEELDVEEIEELDEDKWNKELEKVTLKEVEEHFNAMLVPKEMMHHIAKFAQEIDSADPRGPYYMSTATSSYMVSVIWKQLMKVQTLLNKAIKVVKTSATGVNVVVPNVAKDAFEMTYAAIFACDQEDHWRLDTEDEQANCEIVKKVSKLLKDLLWFHDEELGLIDPFSRKSLLNRFGKLATDWSKIDFLEQKVTFSTPKNGKGMGRRLDVATLDQSAPAPKKAKTIAQFFGAANRDNDSSDIVAHLNGLGDKLSLRTKTVIQLEIVDSSKKKSCQVVCSGSISLKKVGQLVAFLTNHTSEYEYHIQRGKSLKGSYFELSLDGKNKILLGDNAVKKKAQAEGFGYVVDKPVKIVQIFQGLTVGANSGMIFDSNTSKTVSLVWISDKGDRYSLTPQGILPIKCLRNQILPMPRVVDEDYNNARKKTGFSKSIRLANTMLRGDRKAARDSIWFGVSPAQIRQFEQANLRRPVCHKDGSVDVDGLFERVATFTDELIRTAGPPSSF